MTPTPICGTCFLNRVNGGVIGGMHELRDAVICRDGDGIVACHICPQHGLFRRFDYTDYDGNVNQPDMEHNSDGSLTVTTHEIPSNWELGLLYE